MIRVRGGNPRQCQSVLDHAPHVVDHYTTVRWGRLANWCLGRGPRVARLVDRGGSESPAVIAMEEACERTVAQVAGMDDSAA